MTRNYVLKLIEKNFVLPEQKELISLLASSDFLKLLNNYTYTREWYQNFIDLFQEANEGKEVAMPVTTFGAIQQSCLDAFDYYERRQKPEITLCSYAEFLSLLLSFYKYYDGGLSPKTVYILIYEIKRRGIVL